MYPSVYAQLMSRTHCMSFEILVILNMLLPRNILPSSLANLNNENSLVLVLTQIDTTGLLFEVTDHKDQDSEASIQSRACFILCIDF